MHAPTRRLRDLTLPEHRALEGSPLAQALMSGALTPPRYRDVLEAWLCAWAPLEQALARAPQARALGQLSPAPRAALGRADLAWLDQRLPAPGAGHRRAADRPTVCPLPGPESVAAAIGWAYVLRGSALGGQVIARRLLQQLGADLAPAVRFFAAGDDQALSWPRWQQAADARLAAAADLQTAVVAAQSVFRWLGTRFAIDDITRSRDTAAAPLSA